MSPTTNNQFSSRFDLRYLHLYALAAGGLAMLVGVFVLLGWLFDISVFKSVLPGRASMKPLTALCFMLSGVTLVFVTAADGRRAVLRKRCLL